MLIKPATLHFKCQSNSVVIVQDHNCNQLTVEAAWDGLEENFRLAKLEWEMFPKQEIQRPIQQMVRIFHDLINRKRDCLYQNLL